MKPKHFLIICMVAIMLATATLGYLYYNPTHNTDKTLVHTAARVAKPKMKKECPCCADKIKRIQNKIMKRIRASQRGSN